MAVYGGRFGPDLGFDSGTITAVPVAFGVDSDLEFGCRFRMLPCICSFGLSAVGDFGGEVGHDFGVDSCCGLQVILFH